MKLKCQKEARDLATFNVYAEDSDGDRVLEVDITRDSPGSYELYIGYGLAETMNHMPSYHEVVKAAQRWLDAQAPEHLRNDAT